MEIKGFQVVPLGIILSFFLGMAVMYLWQNYSQFPLRLASSPQPTFQPKPSLESEVSLEPEASPRSKVPSDWETYQNEQGLDFRYPAEVVSIAEKESKVILSHSIDYEHPDPCEFRDNTVPLKKLVDFEVSIEFFRKNLKEAVITTEGNYLSDNFLSDNELKIQPNFIDEFVVGSLNGYRLTQGVEGCGRYSYFFPLDSQKTLVLTRSFITEFKPIVLDYEKYLSLPGIISPKEEEKLFNQILSSFNISPQSVKDPETAVESQPSGSETPCASGYIFSQKDCRCIADSFGCQSLDKQSCEQNPNCFSFSRSGSCSCPQCESFLAHQCLPKK